MFGSTVLAGWLNKAKRMVSRWLGKGDAVPVEAEPTVEKAGVAVEAVAVEKDVEPAIEIEPETVVESEAVVAPEVVDEPEADIEQAEDEADVAEVESEVEAEAVIEPEVLIEPEVEAEASVEAEVEPTAEVESEDLVEAVAPVVETASEEEIAADTIPLEEIAVEEIAVVEPDAIVETEMDEQDTMKIDDKMDVEELKADAEPEPGIELEESEAVEAMTENAVHLEVVEEADAETAAREPQGSRQAERMSLKSRVEAVIYAAEEPVTLAQLGALLAEDVLPYLSAGEAAVETETAEQMPMVDAAAGETAQEDHGDSGAPAPEVKSADAKAAEKKAAKEQEKKVKEFIREMVAELMAEYTASERGMEIREVAGGYRMSTKPEYHDTIRAFVKSLKPVLKLSLQALETLAVIAYKQPVTAPEISEIRGVDTSGVLGGLMARKLITTAGRKQVIGRPILYKTTRDFLLRFGLKDLSELPSIEEFEKLAGELTELDEAEEPAQGELLIAAEAETEVAEREEEQPID